VVKRAYAQRRPVVNSYLVRERDRRRLRELALVLVALLPLGLALLVYIWMQLEVVRTGYHIDVLERRLHALGQSERQLRLEASYLASPERIGRRAAAELEMAPPRLEQMVFAEELRR
jgi:cell division protein FtsL